MKPSHMMTNEELATMIRERGVVRGREYLALPGMTNQITRIRAGKGGPGDGTAVLAFWNEAGLGDEANCSDGGRRWHREAHGQIGAAMAGRGDSSRPFAS
jgi:hypothetical protein